MGTAEKQPKERGEAESVTGVPADREFLEHLLETLHEPVLVLTPTLHVKAANPAFFEHFQVRPEDSIGERIYNLGNGQWDIPALRRLLEDVLPNDAAFNDYEVDHVFETLGRRVMLVNARRLDHIQFILLGIRDITEREQRDADLRRSERRLQKMINIEGVAVLTFASDGTLIDANDAFLQMTGYSRERIEARDLHWRDLTPPEHVAESEAQMRRLAETGRVGPYEKEYFLADGSRSWMLFAMADLEDGTIVEYCIDISPQKRAERALRESEERYRALFRESLDAILLADDRGVYTSANPAAGELLGCEPEELVGRAIRDVSGSDEETFERMWDTFMREGRLRGEYRLRNTHGETIDVEFNAVANVLPGCHISSMRDVTDRKRAEEALRRSEERYRSLVAQVTDYAIFSTDREGVVTSWNEGCERVLGYERGEFVGLNVATLFTPEDREAEVPIQELAAAVERGSAGNDHWLVAKNGRRFYASGVTTALRDERGTVTGFSKVIRDETERKVAQDALRESEERLRLAVEGGDLGTWRVDLDTMTDTRDAGLNAILGLDPVETTGPYAESVEFIHPDDRTKAREVWDAAIRGERPYDVEMRVVRPDGEIRWVHDRGEVYRDADGRARFLTGAVVDITRQKQSEELLRFVMQELNHRVRNTLAVVQSTAEQTLRHTRTPREFRVAFGERLRALAKAHLVLTRQEWKGASLRELVLAELEPRVNRAEQLEVKGPGVTLRPNAALALHMSLHELATNAVKYGALREPDGRVEVTWDVTGCERGEEGELVLRWEETGGPRVKPPETTGFGHVVLTRTVSYELGGETALEFDPEGVRCTIRFPWSSRTVAGPARMMS